MWKATSALLLVALTSIGCSKERVGEEPAAAAEGAIGVAECDAYVEKMKAFLETLPAEARSAREPGFKAMQAAWRETAKFESTKANLAATCKAQLAELPQNAAAK
ncbi:MAG TPA: hypothetical protein PK156_27915 [Polyangium sp.]|nr:hypothetical protein [Polyangium sp.]